MWHFVMDKRGAGAGFLRELLFPLPIYISSASPQSSSLSPEAGTIGQEWPQCQLPHNPELKKINIFHIKGRGNNLLRNNSEESPAETMLQARRQNFSNKSEMKFRQYLLLIKK
jgi:hypothetical protein